VSARWPDSTALVVSSVVCLVLISSVTVYSPILPLVSRGTQSEWGLLARPKAAFCGGAKKLRSIELFLGGTVNPEGGEAEAEARRAASAQGLSPISPCPRKEGASERESGRKIDAEGNGRGRLFVAGTFLLLKRLRG
jgi:hypothetical protein